MPTRTLNSFSFFVPAAILCTVFSGCAEKIDTPDEFVELALRHERESQFAEAAAAYRQAIELDPQSAEIWYDLGVVTAAQDKLPEALEAYSTAVELDPTLDRAFNNRATVYARLSQFDKAIDDCTQALTLNPSDALAWRNRGLALYDQGEYERAAADFDESIRIEGQDAETYLYRGNVYLELQDPVRALEDYEHALHINADLGNAWLGQAKSLSALDRSEEAHAALGKSRDLGVESPVDVLSQWDVSAAPVPRESVADVDVINVAMELLKGEYSNLETANAPWDLTSTDSGVTNGFVARVANGECVQFTDDELNEIRQRDDITTTLLVLRHDDSGNLQVVSRYDSWDADFREMRPAVWTLHVTPVEAPNSPAPKPSASVTAVE